MDKIKRSENLSEAFYFKWVDLSYTATCERSKRGVKGEKSKICFLTEADLSYRAPL